MTEINWENLIETELVQIAEKLKRDKNCFIIAHNYQKMEVCGFSEQTSSQ